MKAFTNSFQMHTMKKKKNISANKPPKHVLVKKQNPSMINKRITSKSNYFI